MSGKKFLTERIKAIPGGTAHMSLAEFEKNLWVAVIITAIKDLTSTNRIHRELAQYWLTSDNDNFPAFRAVCGGMGLDYEVIRERIFYNLKKKIQMDSEMYKARHDQV